MCRLELGIINIREHGVGLVCTIIIILSTLTPIPRGSCSSVQYLHFSFIRHDSLFLAASHGHKYGSLSWH